MFESWSVNHIGAHILALIDCIYHQNTIVLLLNNSARQQGKKREKVTDSMWLTVIDDYIAGKG